MFVELSKIATVNLGFKSLQNSFFYIEKPTIDKYGIEKKFRMPILKMRDMNSHSYDQDPTPALWLFHCKEKRADLRGTGALAYIDAMADRAATEKKQTGKSKTIREVLEAQGGGLWYAPKAGTVHRNIWLRKAFDTVFAPFLFAKPALVDQRCNGLSPESGVQWKEVAAAITTSLFAYSLEINGSASMGAGALEAPTSKLRSYPVLDITRLTAAHRAKLVRAAEAVWESESPVDWSNPEQGPGPKLRMLDEWILQIGGRNAKLDAVYADIYDVCRSRIAVAKDKVKKTKSKTTDNIGNVADSIAKAIIQKKHMKNFPEDFVGSSALDVPFSFDRSAIKLINLSQLLGSCDVEVISSVGRSIYAATHPRAVAEAIVRSLLWGRSNFSISSDAKAMDDAIGRFLDWATAIDKDIDLAVSESALGTGYEDLLKREVYVRLGVHPLSAIKVLPAQITI